MGRDNRLRAETPSDNWGSVVAVANPLGFPSACRAPVVAQRLLEREDVTAFAAAMDVRRLVMFRHLMSQPIMSAGEVKMTAGHTARELGALLGFRVGAEMDRERVLGFAALRARRDRTSVGLGILDGNFVRSRRGSEHRQRHRGRRGR